MRGFWILMLVVGVPFGYFLWSVTSHVNKSVDACHQRGGVMLKGYTCIKADLVIDHRNPLPTGAKP